VQKNCLHDSKLPKLVKNYIFSDVDQLKNRPVYVHNSVCAHKIRVLKNGNYALNKSVLCPLLYITWWWRKPKARNIIFYLTNKKVKTTSSLLLWSVFRYYIFK